MPMQSQAQRAYLHIHHPKVAAKFESETPKGAKLPRYKGVKAMISNRLGPKSTK